MIIMDILNQLAQHLETGECDKFIELLNQTPNINVNVAINDSIYQYTLLIKAAHHKMLECVRELVKHGADVNFRIIGKYTVLMTTVDDNSDDSYSDPVCYHIIKFLIESGADCNRPFKDGASLMHFFCWFDVHRKNNKKEYLRDILGLLLEACHTSGGADRNYEYNGQTAETYLRAHNCDDLADFIRDYQVVPDMKGVYDG